MRKQSLDKTDIAIIGHLQVDGRRAYTTCLLYTSDAADE